MVGGCHAIVFCRAEKGVQALASAPSPVRTGAGMGWETKIVK